MTAAEVKRNIWRNALSNYLCLGLRLVLGLVMFRLLYQELSKEEFGFWGLLWSVFGYGLLLDFGFGFTAQKRVAELSVRHEWQTLSRVLSTIFFSYVVVAAVVVLAGIFASDAIIGLFQISAGKRDEFRQVFTLFLCGLGIAFPLGLFPEILRGQQRIALANAVFAGGIIANFVLVWLAVHWNWSLRALVVIALLSTLVPDLVCGILALRRMPEVQIRPRHFSRRMVRQTMSFSLFAYVASLSNLLMAKTDQLIISSAIAVSAVALYQAAAKVAEMFGSLSLQLPEAFSPAAAHLNAKGDRGELKELLVNGTRFTVILATPLYLVCAFYMEGLLRVLTGEMISTTFWVGQILLFWSYTSVVTQSVSKRIYMMCGHEKRLMALGVAEALLNLALSIALVIFFKSVIGVALASLVSTLIFGWVFLWPWAAREAQLSGWKLARLVLGPPWLACLPLLLLMLCQRAIPSLDFQRDSRLFAIEGLLAGLLGAVSVWRMALSDAERSRLSSEFARRLGKRRHA